MKLSLRPFFLIASLAAIAQLSAADRWSSDETAVRMGLNAWFSIWTRPGATAGDPEVKTLYATPPSASLPAVVQTASRAGALPSAMSQPERFAVTMQGDRAISSFTLAPQKSAGGEALADPAAQVVLTWERRSGMWQIVRETITPESEPREQVALSEPVRK